MKVRNNNFNKNKRKNNDERTQKCCYEIEYEWVHRKVSNFGIQGKLISAFCGGKLFVAVKVWYPMKEKVGSEFYMYRKRYADIYDTYALFTVPDC